MSVKQNETGWRRNVATEFVQMVVDELLPAETAAECLHRAGVATDLSITQVTNLTATAAEAQALRDRLTSDPDAICGLLDFDDVYGEALQRAADDRAMDEDDTYRSAIAQLAAEPVPAQAVA